MDYRVPQLDPFLFLKTLRTDFLFTGGSDKELEPGGDCQSEK